MTIYRDANLNIIATNGEFVPNASARVSPQAKSTAATQNASTTAVADVKYNDPTTGNLIADRS